MKKILYILLIFSSFSFAQSDALFKKANNLYNAEDYKQAIATYEQLLSTKEHSSELYFNLGNAHYKLNQLAESIYNYEKALQLNPSDEDTRVNLAFANNQKIDKIDSIPLSGFNKIINEVINNYHFDVWAIVTIVAMFIFIVLLGGYLFSMGTRIKRLFFIIATVTFFIGITTLIFAYQQEENATKNVYAIVFEKESQVKTDPKLNSDQAFVLHEGTKVKVLESFDGWVKIKITNGSMGWIDSKEIKNL